MIKRRRPPLADTYRDIEIAVRELRQLEEALTRNASPLTPADDRSSPDTLLAQLRGTRRRLNKLLPTGKTHERGPSRRPRRGSFFRKFSRDRAQTTRNGASFDIISEAHDRMDAAATIAHERMRMAARMHDEAAKVVGTTLERSTKREQAVAQENPEIAPYLSAYFDASRRSLLENTVNLLETSWDQSQRSGDEEQGSHGTA